MMSIADPIMRDIKINATQLGIMSSTYFLFYAITQPLVGYLTDKYGPKRIILASFAFTVFTTVLFAFSQTFQSAIVARALMGISTGGIFIPSIKLIAENFSSAQFSKINGIYLGIGGAGAAFLATIPLIYLEVAAGWRMAFFLYSIICVFLVFCIQFVIKSNNDMHTQKAILQKSVDHSNQANYFEEVKKFIFSRNFLLLEIIFFISFGVYISFQGLWATNYLANMLNISHAMAGNIIFALPVGLMLGSMTAGYLSDKVFRCRLIPLRLSLVLMAVSWALITLFSDRLSVALILIILALLGYATGIISPIVFSIISDMVSPEARGVSFGLVNPSSLAGIFVFQIITGKILDLYTINNVYTSKTYFMMMSFCMFALIVIAVISFLMKETMIINDKELQPAVKPVISFRLLENILSLIPKRRFNYVFAPINIYNSRPFDRLILHRRRLRRRMF